MVYLLLLLPKFKNKAVNKVLKFLSRMFLLNIISDVNKSQFLIYNKYEILLYIYLKTVIQKAPNSKKSSDLLQKDNQNLKMNVYLSESTTDHAVINIEKL